MSEAASIFRDDILAGRRALVTGGATGIGRGIATALARHGARVCLASRKADVLEKAAAEIAAETGQTIISVAADVRDAEAVTRAVDHCTSELGGLDIVVNNAAGNFLAPAATMSSNAFRSVVEIDLLGTFHVSRAAFDALVESGRGSILNISATLHYQGTPLQAHAASAKAGIDGLTRTLAVEWGRLGVRVNAIAPGPIGDTEGMRRLAPGKAGEIVAKAIPVGRMGTVRDIADCAVYLSSDAAAFVNGAIFVIDGGQHLASPALMMMT